MLTKEQAADKEKILDNLNVYYDDAEESWYAESDLVSLVGSGMTKQAAYGHLDRMIQTIMMQNWELPVTDQGFAELTSRRKIQDSISFPRE